MAHHRFCGRRLEKRTEQIGRIFAHCARPCLGRTQKKTRIAGLPLFIIVVDHAGQPHTVDPGGAVFADHAARLCAAALAHGLRQNFGMGDDPDLAGPCRLRDHVGERRQHVGMQARLRLVERDQRRQAIGHQGRGKAEKADLAIGELARLEDAIGKFRQHQAEIRRFLRHRHDEPRTAECCCDHSVEFDGVSSYMHKRGESSCNVGAVFIQHRRRDRKARRTQRRAAIGAKPVIESPGFDGAPEGADLRIMSGITKQRNRGFRRQGLLAIGFHPARLASHRNTRPVALHHRYRPASGFERKLFGLDFRLKRETRRGRRPHASLDRVAEGRRPLHIEQLDVEADAGGFVRTPLARPHGGEHAALAGNLMRQPAANSSLHELQRAIEVGLADAVLADEQIDVGEIHADRAQGTIIPGKHGA
ncbi:Sugar transporter [Rhizobium freirei PRF 81]|uniref:Sugar transporter n=1 Tax=Rhizobium freirei PRF 81 TaxID=363754 RepID=N6V8U1_9HYPH|nr:Sugar transporter [Rhizobium freirei PRF 81]